MARKTKEEAEQTYHALLDSAADLFTQKGVSNTTLNDIATQTGMTRGAVYWHFDNKDNVIMALWERNAAATHQDFVEQMRLDETSDPNTMFRLAIKGIVQRVANEPQLAQVMRIVMNNVELTDEQTELQLFLQGKKNLLHSNLTAAFETLQQCKALRTTTSPALLSHSLLAYLHGLIHAYLEPGSDNIDLNKDGEALLELYLNAILL